MFRLLVQAGPEGMPAGQVAEALDLAPNTLTFHFDRLRVAGLVTVRREGRSMIYAARYETMNALLGYLTENCCGGVAECAPAPAPRKLPHARRKRRCAHECRSIDLPVAVIGGGPVGLAAAAHLVTRGLP